MSTASFYKWRSKYGGMDVAMLSEMKAMAEENKRLKRMYAESQMQNELLKEALMNITTSVDSFDKLNCFQGVVDESTSTKRYFSQTQSI